MRCSRKAQAEIEPSGTRYRHPDDNAAALQARFDAGEVVLRDLTVLKPETLLTKAKGLFPAQPGVMLPEILAEDSLSVHHGLLIAPIQDVHALLGDCFLQLGDAFGPSVGQSATGAQLVVGTLFAFVIGYASIAWLLILHIRIFTKT